MDLFLTSKYFNAENCRSVQRVMSFNNIATYGRPTYIFRKISSSHVIVITAFLV